MRMTVKDSLERYTCLPYRIVLSPSPEGGYVAEIPELPGCVSQGETIQESLQMVDDAKRCWIADALERNEMIPEPVPEEGYSGRILLRAPKSLHRLLTERARIEGVSLNQFIVYSLSRAIGKFGPEQA